MSAPVTGRTTLAQLTTARLLLAQYRGQLGEWEGMGAKRRVRTARGRDLAARLDGLRDGEVKWSQRVADLEATLAAEQAAG